MFIFDKPFPMTRGEQKIRIAEWDEYIDEFNSRTQRERQERIFHSLVYKKS